VTNRKFGVFSPYSEGIAPNLASEARSSPATLWVRLGRDLPYPVESIRSVTLVSEAGRLYLDVTAEVPVVAEDLDPTRVAGVDPGIIHPFAMVTADEGLLVSGRAIRAEERLHLEDSKRRSEKMGRKAPTKGQKGSRRWRRLRAGQRRAEAAHRRRVRQAHHEAATAVVGWLVDRRVATVVVGDPKGITTRDCGRRQNWRLRTWRRTHLLACLADKAELAGIKVVVVNERGTSSSCPECHRPVPKPKGALLFLSALQLQGPPRFRRGPKHRRPRRRIHACNRTRDAPSGCVSPSTA